MVRITCSFVQSSDLFEDCLTVYDAFSDSDPDMSWGDNNRTLISVERMTNAIRECADDNNDVDEKELNTVMDRLLVLPTSVYIDLEN